MHCFTREKKRHWPRHTSAQSLVKQAYGPLHVYWFTCSRIISRNIMAGRKKKLSQLNNQFLLLAFTQQLYLVDRSSLRIYPVYFHFFGKTLFIFMILSWMRSFLNWHKESQHDNLTLRKSRNLKKHKWRWRKSNGHELREVIQIWDNKT